MRSVCSGEAAASGARAGEVHARAGAGDAAERERGRTFQNMGRTGGQLSPASGQTEVTLFRRVVFSYIHVIGPFVTCFWDVMQV